MSHFKYRNLLKGHGGGGRRMSSTSVYAHPSGQKLFYIYVHLHRGDGRALSPLWALPGLPQHPSEQAEHISNLLIAVADKEDS